MSETWMESELKAALEETYRPAPWLLSSAMDSVRRPHRNRRQPLAWIAGAVAVVLTLSSIAVFQAIRHQQATVQTNPGNASHLPQPIRQPITRTSPAAQVAWMSALSQNQQPYLLGIDPAGRVVGRLNQYADSYGVWRSADGATIYVPGTDRITAYSALDGSAVRAYALNPGTIVGDAFSRDGRWLALLVLDKGLQLQLIDLPAGTSQALAVPHDPHASTPGMVCSPNPDCATSVAWALVVFSPDSTHLYALSDWGGPARLSAFSLAGTRLVSQGASPVEGQQGAKSASCAGPAMAAKVVGGGRTLVAFCHADGAVWFFDLNTLTAPEIVRAKQSSPFLLSPIFTPDGQLLYLQDGAGPSVSMQVIDLAKRTLLGPVATPTDTGENGPFGWLFTDAYAGGVASTVPVSPDGLRLYAATSDGVMVLRVPDLKPIARLASGFKANEVWISGDGQTIYATSQDYRTLLVVHADGSNQRTVNLSDPGGGFIASEHG